MGTVRFIMSVEERYKKKLISIISKHLPQAKIYLYGSRAREDSRQGSDIDLAVDAGEKINWGILCKITSEIDDSTIPFFVDVSDLYNVSEDFKKTIAKDFVAWKE